MSPYISLLRGINVSGQKKIKMDELRAMYESLGCANVQSYIQSGNVIFEFRKAADASVVKMIEATIKKTFGFEVSVIIRSHDELVAVTRRNPFLGKAGTDTSGLYVTFLAGKPAPSAVQSLKDFDARGDEVAVLGREVYLYCKNGYGRSKLNNNLVEKKLSVIASTRNWKTVNVLLDMADQSR